VTLTATFQEAGVAVRRCNGQDLYEWLLPFFNRKPGFAADAGQLLRLAPYPDDDAGLGQTAGTDGPDDPGVAPIFGWDLSEQLNYSEPKSDLNKGTFAFDGVPVCALVLQSMRREPGIGHFSAELASGKENFARFDRLPPGSMLSITVTIRQQHLVERHVERIHDASRAKNALAQEAHGECEQVLARMIAGDKLLPMFLTLYVTGESQERLEAAISEVNALLTSTRLRFIDPKEDLAPLDAFLRGLPFNYDSAFDEKHLKRSRLTFASQIAELLPVYGRSKGSPHPTMWFWNRSGEPLWLDPLNKLDRCKNAHMLVLGPTGAGKSATLNYLAMMALTIHRPRLVIVDAGNSFGLLVQWCKSMGLSTYSANLSAGDAEVSLPPFVHACRLLEDRELMGAFHAAADRPVPDGLSGALGQDDAAAAKGRDDDQEEDQDPDQ
jgi:conjugative transfer ATPase